MNFLLSFRKITGKRQKMTTYYLHMKHFSDDDYTLNSPSLSSFFVLFLKYFFECMDDGDFKFSFVLSHCKKKGDYTTCVALENPLRRQMNKSRIWNRVHYWLIYSSLLCLFLLQSILCPNMRCPTYIKLKHKCVTTKKHAKYQQQQQTSIIKACTLIFSISFLLHYSENKQHYIYNNIKNNKTSLTWLTHDFLLISHVSIVYYLKQQQLQQQPLLAKNYFKKIHGFHLLNNKNQVLYALLHMFNASIKLKIFILFM